MATLLVWPRAGEGLGALSYGRWATLHLDLLLYGWSALPLVGLLLRGVGAAGSRPRWSIGAVWLWSGSLLFAASWWLAGHTSGRLFVEWSGPARGLFTANLVWLWCVLASSLVDRRIGDGRRRAWRAMVVVALAPVPWAFWSGTRVTFHPPINPASGGPTGDGLLASSLGLVVVFLLTPLLLELPQVGGRRWIRVIWLLLGLHFALFLAWRGEHSHRDPREVAALASVALWLPFVIRAWRSYAWPAAARRWRHALLGWSSFLVVTAVLPYLWPELLDAWKFTDVLVAHAHLAMAGVVTAFVAVVLVSLAEGTTLQHVLAPRGSFWTWQAGCIVFVASMALLGTLEAGRPDLLYRPSTAASVLLWVRCAAGVAMTGAAVSWLRGCRSCTLGNEATAEVAR